MATGTEGINKAGTAAASTPSSVSLTNKNQQVGKTEFLQLLVTQLRNQDPLNPMENSQFAVDLAQFSQVEQLISINDKLGGGEGDVNSLVGYLGREVTLNSDEIEVKGNHGGYLKVDLAKDAVNLEVDVLREDGSVKETVSLGAVEAGKHVIELSNLKTESGSFDVQVRAQLIDGSSVEPEAYATGVVSGFIPGPEPTLLVGSREVKPGEIREVSLIHTS